MNETKLLHITTNLQLSCTKRIKPYCILEWRVALLKGKDMMVVKSTILNRFLKYLPYKTKLKPTLLGKCKDLSFFETQDIVQRSTLWFLGCCCVIPGSIQSDDHHSIADLAHIVAQKLNESQQRHLNVSMCVHVFTYTYKSKTLQYIHNTYQNIYASMCLNV